MKKLAITIALLVLLALAVGSLYRRSLPRPSDWVVRASDKKIFHVPTCKWARKINERFKTNHATSWDAWQEGNRPCKVCAHLMLNLPSRYGGAGGVPSQGNPWHSEEVKTRAQEEQQFRTRQREDEEFLDVDD